MESTRKMRGSSYAPSTSFYTRSASPQNSGRRRGAPLRSKLLISNFRRTPAISGWTDSSASFTQRFPKAGTSRTSSARGPSAWRTHSAFWLSAASPTKVNCVVRSIYRVRWHLFFLVSVPPLAMSLMSHSRYPWCRRQHGILTILPSVNSLNWFEKKNWSKCNWKREIITHKEVTWPSFQPNSNHPIDCVGANDGAGISGTTLNVPVPVSKVDWSSKTDTDTGAGVTSPLNLYI